MLGQAHRNGREVEHREQAQRAEASSLREEAEHQPQTDRDEERGDDEVERADPRGVAERMEHACERARRRLRYPADDHAASGAPARPHAGRSSFVYPWYRKCQPISVRSTTSVIC